MAGRETAASEDELFLQIQSLVSDSLCVVSFKWLSRNFSLSSNDARRLLQKFAKQNEDLDLEVVYAISGWSSKEPSSYSIQLVPKSKLEEAKAVLKESPSIHVYSVQRCLPKDPAQLWSADFVQAEQLFNESADINNCLRDNRFSAVTCKLVQRLPSRQNCLVTSRPHPQPLIPNKVANISPQSTLVPKAPALKSPVPSLPPKIPETTLKDASGGKKPVPQSTSLKPHSESKESSGPGTAGKRKAPPVTGGSGGGASLARMWGKAPTKPTTVTPVVATATIAANPPQPAVTAGDAEARIQALEAEADSEDDMATEFASLRRGQVIYGGGRRRRMIVDDDDDDDGDAAAVGDDNAEGDDDSETIIRLGTPESPQETKPAVDSTRDNLGMNGGASSTHEKLPKPNKEILKVQGKPSTLQPNLQPSLDSETKVVEAAEVKAHPLVPASNPARGGSKRKKVLKTRIDERGREVTEVVFETEGEEKENVEKDVTPKAKHSTSTSKQTDIKTPTGKPQVVPKPSTAPSKTAASKASTKTSAKSASKAGKGQGNIMSFFKKT